MQCDDESVNTKGMSGLTFDMSGGAKGAKRPLDELGGPSSFPPLRLPGGGGRTTALQEVGTLQLAQCAKTAGSVKSGLQRSL